MKSKLTIVTVAITTVTIAVSLFSTFFITVGYGSISPPLSFPPRYQDPNDPNNMTRTCENLAEQDAKGLGVLPMDFLACFDWLDNATLIRNGLNPADKEMPLDQRDTPAIRPTTYARGFIQFQEIIQI